MISHGVRVRDRRPGSVSDLSGLNCPVCPGIGLEIGRFHGNLPGMKTLTVDDYQRVRLPDEKPRSKLAYEKDADGIIRLVPVKAEGKEPFPRGSLLKYITPQRNAEQLAILKSCTLE